MYLFANDDEKPQSVEDMIEAKRSEIQTPGVNDVIAPGAFDSQIGKVVAIVNRNIDPPMQVGVGTITSVSDGVGFSAQFFHLTHALIPRGELSTNDTDVECAACNACSCHATAALFEACTGPRRNL